VNKVGGVWCALAMDLLFSIWHKFICTFADIGPIRPSLSKRRCGISAVPHGQYECETSIFGWQ
jgi:hypothetical protein